MALNNAILYTKIKDNFIKIYLLLYSFMIYKNRLLNGFHLPSKSITDMSGMFSCCESLSSLPDIAKWDTQNVTDMNYMFSYCKSLSSLPDISKWDTQNVTNMSDIFGDCKSLSSLPDILKWNIKNVTNMSGMFMAVIHYHHYQIFQNGILKWLLK